MPRIYLSPPHASGDESTWVAEAIASNWIAPLGPHVDAFEREIAEYVGVTHAVALSSGTAGLHLALILAGVVRGDDVLCPTLTFAATANAITYQGARPVFVDASPETWTLDPELVEDELRRRDREGRQVKAVVTVDLYGQCADYGRLQPVCDRYAVTLIEDAAEALGSTHRGSRAGYFGSMAVFSFNGNKIITTSGGGMLVSNDGEAIARARFLSTQARDPAPHYEHSVVGYNYRMSNILAAIGRCQLRSLEDRVSARRRNFETYRELLGGLPGVEFMPEGQNGTSNRWLTCLTIDPDRFGASREDVRLALEADDIEARPVWKPMHLQPAFADAPQIGGAVAAHLFEHGLCLPSGSALTAGDLERIASIVRRTGRF